MRVGDGAAGFSIFRSCYCRQICRCKTDKSATSFIYPKGEQEEQKFKYWIMALQESLVRIGIVSLCAPKR